MLNRNKTRKVTFEQKYSRGFYILLCSLVFISVVAMSTTYGINEAYKNSTHVLKVLQTTQENVECTNTAVDNFYLFLSDNYYINYIQYANEMKTQSIELQTQVNLNYSREVADYYYAIDTYGSSANKFADTVLVYNSNEMKNQTIAILENDYNILQNQYETVLLAYSAAYSEQMTLMQNTEQKVDFFITVLTSVQILAVIFAVAISLYNFNKVKNVFLSSIQKLTIFAKTIASTGEYPKTGIIINTGDEIELLATTFNEMLKANEMQLKQIKENANIKERMQQIEMDNIKITSDLKESQYKLLESRINPHFLFNTLNMVLQTSYMEKADETSKLIEATADFLRYNLSQLSKIGTVEKEVVNVKNYTYIQQCRYGDRIKFNYNIDEKTYEYNMPCMIIQPLVENAIIHGTADMTQNAIVNISIYEKNDMLVLRVADNGKGIEKKELKRIRQSIKRKEMSNNHMGLQNIYMRLKLYFGDIVYLDINSEKGNTIFEFSVPREVS